MSAVVFLPSNPYISIFDFRLRFDLTDGTIKVDLSPSSISDASGISIAVAIKTPDQTVIDHFVFAGANANSVYAEPFPRVQNVYMWGSYLVTGTLTLQGQDYMLFKRFNMCAPDSKNPYALEMTGNIQLSVDCAMGVLTAHGFGGYGYKQVPPSAETWNLTRYYPPEAELLPQKNLSIIPFSVDAYVGLNKVKGVNTSTYDYGDNIFALVNIVAAAEKNIRCGMDMAQVYCGMKALLDTLASCNASQTDYNNAFGEINALLWTVTVGINENKDVDDEIMRLEKLLGVDCRCSACAGERVGPGCESVCPQVQEVVAVVAPDTAAALNPFFIALSVDSTGMNGMTLQIKYRPFCDPANPGTQRQAADWPLTGGPQSTQIGIPDDQTYQLQLTSVMADGTHCAMMTVIAPGLCPQIVSFNQPPPPPPTQLVQVHWGWSATPLTPANLPLLIYQESASIAHNADIVADFTAAPVNTQYLAVQFPLTENPKYQWINSAQNFGQIPDQVFAAYQDANFHYIFSRVKPALQGNNKTITFKT